MNDNGPSKGVDVSLVICTYNRSRILERTLTSVVAQEVPAHISWEAIVVDNASTDDTPRVVERFAASCPHLRYVREPESGISHARNRGLKEFAGDLLCFIDDDVTVDPDHVLKAYAAWQTDAWDLAGGRVVADYAAPRPAWLDGLPRQTLNGPLGLYDRGEQDFVLDPDDDYVPPTCNMFIPRSTIEKVGIFDADLGRIRRKLRAGEDTDFCERAQRKGLRIGYCGSCVGRHLVPKSRLTRSHFLRWNYTMQMTGTNEMLPASTVFWLRVPRFNWRRLGLSLLRLPPALFTPRRFQRLLESTAAAGAALGYLTRRRKYSVDDAPPAPEPDP